VSFDDLVLSLQRAIDRIIRRLRRGAAPERTQKPLLIVQIDGLSRFVLARALDSGQMPFLARLLERHGYRLSAMSVGLPTSTPAFQMAMMSGYGQTFPASITTIAPGEATSTFRGSDTPRGSKPGRLRAGPAF